MPTYMADVLSFQRLSLLSAQSQEEDMSASSRAVHDAVVTLQDAASAATAFGRAASMLIEVLKTVAELEARVDALEHKVVIPKDIDASNGRRGAGLQPKILAEMRSHVDTNTAAGLLGRAPQTLRKWACYEDGPLRPVRVNGRLAWAVADIHRLLSNGKS